VPELLIINTRAPS